MPSHTPVRSHVVKSIVTVLAVLLALAGCSGSSSGDNTDAATTTATPVPTPTETTPTPKPKKGPFVISVKVSGRGAHILLTGTTNLPDGALVTIGVTRNVKYKKDSDPRAVMLGGDGVKVSSGKFRADLTTTERQSIASNESSFGSIETVADTIIGCAQIRSNNADESPQPPVVAQAMGKDGKNLKTSPQKQSFGSALNLEASDTVVFPSPALGALGASHKKTVDKPFCTI